LLRTQITSFKFINSNLPEDIIEHVDDTQDVFRNFSENLQLSNIRQLDLSSNSAAATINKYLPKESPWLHNLAMLNLSNNKLGSETLQSLASLLPSMGNLEYLNLSNTDMDDEGVELLAPSFPYLKKLKVLKLTGNLIENNGLSILAKKLPSLSQIHTLSLSGNNQKIDYVKIDGIAVSVQHLKNLKTLDISLMEIDEQGMAYLVQSTRGLQGLEVICFEDNFIDDTEIKCLTDNLIYLSNLKSFHLLGSNVKLEHIQVLVPSFKLLPLI